MKTLKNIYPKIYDLENLRAAHHNARKDKLFYKDVKMVDRNEDFYLKQIQNLLKKKKYKVSEYIHKKQIEGHKLREIDKLPYYPDRIIQ